MSTFEIILIVYAVLLAIAALAVVYRMIIGPTILDRAISSDFLVTLVVMAMALYTARAEAAWAGPAMLGLTALAFIATVTFARFVAREEPGGAHLRPHPDEPSTTTGPLDAVHFSAAQEDPDSDGPVNRFEPGAASAAAYEHWPQAGGAGERLGADAGQRAGSDAARRGGADVGQRRDRTEEGR